MQVIIEFFQLLMGGVSQIFSFLLTLPSILETCMLAFPPYLTVCLITGFLLILLVRVLELLP